MDLSKFMKLKRWFLGNSLLLLAALSSGFLSIVVINKYMDWQTGGKIQKSVTGIPAEEPKTVAIVFGTCVRSGVGFAL